MLSVAPEGSNSSKIVMRLGDFHLLTPRVVAIAYIMQGSGIKEVMYLIYAPNSLEKILNGHNYARAIGAHTLLHLSLATIYQMTLLLMTRKIQSPKLLKSLF